MDILCGEYPYLKLASKAVIHWQLYIADDNDKDPIYFIYSSGYPQTRIQQKQIMASEF